MKSWAPNLTEFNTILCSFAAPIESVVLNELANLGQFPCFLTNFANLEKLVLWI